MKLELIRAFYGNEPAVICTAGSYVVAANERLCDSKRGERLFDYMSDMDVLRFNAAFNSRGGGDGVCFPLSDYHGLSFARAFFDSVGDNSYCLVMLFNKEDRALSCDPFKRRCKGGECDGQRAAEISYALGLYLQEFPDSARVRKLSDLCCECKTIIKSLTAEGVVGKRLTFAESGGERADEPAFVDMSLSNLMQIILLCSAIMAEICQNKAVAIKACRQNERIELQFCAGKVKGGARVRSVEDIVLLFPSTERLISLYKYILSVSNCSAGIIADGKSTTPTLYVSLNETADEVRDFKSSDLAVAVEEEYGRLKKYMEHLLSSRP